MFKKIFILFLFISVKSLAQTLPFNIGFEDGSFAGWVCAAGVITTDGTINLRIVDPIPGQHTLFRRLNDGNGLDPYGDFPVVCPNGSNYSIRLGNEQTGAQAEGISYTFTVPSLSQSSITFNYAVVLQNPPHGANEQPKFTAKVYDITDDKYVDCPSFDFVAGTSLPGFNLSSKKATGGRGAAIDIYYKDWSTATIDLRSYIGKQMRIEFATNDCTKGGHFGYAYLDVGDEGTRPPITGNAYCATQTSVTLKGPIGYSEYLWYNDDFSKFIGSGQVLKISPAPPNLAKYALRILPYDGVGCVDTLNTVINKIDNGFRLKLVDTVHGCANTGVDLTTAYVTDGSSPGMKYTYFLDGEEKAQVNNPKAIVTSGIYYIKGINNEGCESTLPIYVKIEPPVLKLSKPEPVTFPATVDLSTTYVKQSGLSYSYYTDATATIPLTNYRAIDHTGKFYVKAINTYGCSAIASVDVTILPPPPYIISAVNAFTPNNDGVNDYFNLHIEGYVKFNKLDVFNRYGNLVYTAKSSDTSWDGSFNGKNLPAGTYYWLFDGTDTFYNTKITKSGSVAIIR
ncbi:gliding motility-associated C-terminal domain-containing protein [Mucilaginibacter sp. UYCu711]|uniref:gliding motility-associated C-terminal domain-containing protein n=1 Tax=Mucilaginibacter sp. UYCu711 TaxID=3156339 RepID=UPI003D1DEBD8